MGLNAAQARQYSKPLTIAFDGLGELNIQYRPAAVTPAKERAYLEMNRRLAEEGQDTVLPWLTRICEVVSDWDLENDNAKGETYRVPLKPKELEVIPSVLLTGMWEAIQEDQNFHPLRKKPGSSASGGSRGVPVGARRNGSEAGESVSSFE